MQRRKIFVHREIAALEGSFQPGESLGPLEVYKKNRKRYDSLPAFVQEAVRAQILRFVWLRSTLYLGDRFFRGISEVVRVNTYWNGMKADGRGRPYKRAVMKVPEIEETILRYMHLAIGGESGLHGERAKVMYIYLSNKLGFDLQPVMIKTKIRELLYLSTNPLLNLATLIKAFDPYTRLMRATELWRSQRDTANKLTVYLLSTDEINQCFHRIRLRVRDGRETSGSLYTLNKLLRHKWKFDTIPTDEKEVWRKGMLNAMEDVTIDDEFRRCLNAFCTR